MDIQVWLDISDPVRPEYTIDTFRGSTPDPRSSTLYTGNSDDSITYAPDHFMCEFRSGVCIQAGMHYITRVWDGVQSLNIRRWKEVLYYMERFQVHIPDQYAKRIYQLYIHPGHWVGAKTRYNLLFVVLFCSFFFQFFFFFFSFFYPNFLFFLVLFIRKTL